MKPICVEGEPTVFLSGNAARERSWQSAVLEGTRGHVFGRPRLVLRVSSFRRGGHYFDLDNIAKHVLDQLEGTVETVWLEMIESPTPGVEISEEAPPTAPDGAVSFDIAIPPGRSIKGTVLPELVGLPVVGEAHFPLGVGISFADSAAEIGRFDFNGPIKPFLDAMQPLFGMHGRLGADHRVRELRLWRGDRSVTSGARVWVWVLTGDI